MIDILISIIILAVFFKTVEWFISYVGISEPFITLIRLIAGAVVLIYLMNIFSGFLW